MRSLAQSAPGRQPGGPEEPVRSGGPRPGGGGGAVLGREAGFVYTYSQCADPVIAVRFARGAPGGAALRPGRGGAGRRAVRRRGSVPTRWWSWRDSLGHGPLRRAAGDGWPSGAR
jgi:hypothetical protein